MLVCKKMTANRETIWHYIFRFAFDMLVCKKWQQVDRQYRTIYSVLHCIYMLMNKKRQHIELHFIKPIVLTESQPSHTKKKQDLTKKLALPESSRSTDCSHGHAQDFITTILSSWHWPVLGTDLLKNAADAACSRWWWEPGRWRRSGVVAGRRRRWRSGGRWWADLRGLR
jgi:hypothetical protein